MSETKENLNLDSVNSSYTNDYLEKTKKSIKKNKELINCCKVNSTAWNFYKKHGEWLESELERLS